MSDAPADPAAPGWTPSARDWLLMPLIALLAVVVAALTAEAIGARLFRESGTTMPCLVADDAATGVRGIPDARCASATLESAEVAYQFNREGHRTPQRDFAKPPGTFRIVAIGSSLVEGMRVSAERSVAGRLPDLLRARLRRPIDLYNEGMQWGTPTTTARRIDRAMAAHPDLLLWPLTPWDIENVALVLPYVSDQRPGLSEPLGGNVADPIDDPAPKPFAARIAGAWQRRVIAPLGDTRAVFLLQQALYRSPSQYLRHYVLQGEAAGYLRSDLSPYWERRLAAFDRALGVVARQSRAARVPLVLTVVPSEAAALLLASGKPQPGLDPMRIEGRLRAIAARHGVGWVSIAPGFRGQPEVERLYLPIDAHLTAEGNAFVANRLAEALAPVIAPLRARP